MKLRIVSIIILLLAFAINISATSVTRLNPFETAAFSKDAEIINGSISDAEMNQTATLAEQITITQQFKKIHKWQRQYNQYLQTASGYASTLKASTTLFSQAIDTFLYLRDLGGSLLHHTQGWFGTAFLTNMYTEVLMEFCTVYSILDQSIAKGGESNMLTGPERSQLLWKITDSMAKLNEKLMRLNYCIRYYKFRDIWNTLTNVIGIDNKGTMATQAFDRWKRASETHMNRH